MLVSLQEDTLGIPSLLSPELYVQLNTVLYIIQIT